MADALPAVRDADFEVVTIEPSATLSTPLTADEVMAQITLVQEVMARAMREGEHYGVIPGTSGKPTLLKAGAEKLSLLFKLRPKFTIERLDGEDGHREYIVTCDMYDSAGGHQGQGVGSCSTMESKYRYRKQERVCPKCKKPAIIKGREEYGGGWLCWKKKDGCGAKFADGDAQIEGQEAGKIENPDIADIYNTVLKMAKKRAQVDATLTATAASDLFTQDLEEMRQNAAMSKPPVNPTTFVGSEVAPPQWDDDAPWNSNDPQPAPAKAPGAEVEVEGPDDAEIGRRLLLVCKALSEGEDSDVPTLLHRVSGYVGRDGSPVATESIDDLMAKPRWLMTTYGKAKRAYDETHGAGAAFALIENSTTGQPHPDDILPEHRAEVIHALETIAGHQAEWTHEFLQRYGFGLKDWQRAIENAAAHIVRTMYDELVQHKAIGGES